MAQNKNGFDLTIKLSTATKIMVVIGLLCIVFSNYLPSIFPNLPIDSKPIAKITEIIGTSLFSAGLVSVIVEISTIRNIVTNAFKNILSGIFEIDGLNQTALMKLKRDISLKLLGTENKDLTNTPYKYEEQLLESVNEKFYKHHNVTYHITPDEKNNCFHVKVKIDYNIINKNLKNNKFEVRLKLYELPNSTTEIANNFSVSLSINGNTIDTKEILNSEPITHDGESTYYNRKIKISKELTGIKNRIKAELNYDVPLFDICQSFKISAHVKILNINFT